MPKLPLWAYVVGGIIALGVANYFSLLAGDQLIDKIRRIRR